MLKYLFIVFICPIIIVVTGVLIHTEAFCQSYEIYKNDTINKKDVKGIKHGKWITFNRAGSHPGYADSALVEEGSYADGKKSGIWVKYYYSGSPKQELTFTNGIPEGKASFYYENGKLQETGYWKVFRWLGEYKYYFDNGQLSYLWSYNEEGKRDGKQLYYHKNGNLMIAGEWANGQESGVMREYHEDGSLMSEKYAENGIIDVKSIKTFDKGLVAGENVVKKEEKLVDFNIKDGVHKTYNQSGLIEREGIFKNNILMEGKTYIYDKAGVRVKTVYFKDGKKMREE